MSAHLLTFPARGPFAVHVVPDRDGQWLVTCRDHAWLFGTEAQARAEAAKIAAGFGVAVEVVREVPPAGNGARAAIDDEIAF
jgi:hypothetical protein